MSESKIYDTTRIKIESVQIVQASLETEKAYFDHRTPHRQITVNYTQGSGFSPETERAFIKLGVEIIGKDENDNPIGVKAKYEIDFFF